MKKIIISNSYIVPTFEFLKDLPLKANKASRGRTQFLKRLEEKQNEYNESLMEINKKYFKVDDNKELIVEDDQYTFKKDDEEFKLERTKEVNELLEEETEILFGEYSTKYEALFTALDDLEIELSGRDAIVYDVLMESYEANEDKKEEGK